MTDVRAQLADVLREHLEVWDRFTQRYVCTCDKWTDDDRPRFWEHLADVLLAQPGIAIVGQSDLDQLLAVATLYVNAFSADEMLTLPERLRLQGIEDILAAAAAAEQGGDHD